MDSVVDAISALLPAVPWDAFFSHILAFLGGIFSVFVYKFVPDTLKQWRSEWQSDRIDAMEWYENVATDAQTVAKTVRTAPDDDQLKSAIDDLDERLNTPPMLVETEVENVAQTVVNIHADFDSDSPKLRQQLRTKATKLRSLADENATEKRKRATFVRRFLQRLSP